jgi:predicted protein tyrosine phosphatase
MKKRKSILTSIVNLASTMVLKSPKTRAMTVSQNPAIQIPTNRRTMKAKTILDAEKKDAIAIAKKSREKLHRQNLFTKLVASLNRHGSIKSDISERRKET